MLPGLMQKSPLLVINILRYADQAHGNREIVSRLVEEPTWRYDYSALARRAAAAANMLRRLGVEPGTRVSSLAWNTHRHVELFYAVPGIGAVLHTANPRLSDEQIVYTIAHAGSTVLFFDKSFLPMVERLKSQLPSIHSFVMLSDEERLDPGTIRALCYEVLLGRESTEFSWPYFDENAGAILCYTSGTTGSPKGVLYSHRSITLHAMAAGLSAAMGLSAFDCVMPCQSLYHVTAWGLPFIAPMNGCKLVLPCERMDGVGLQQLIEEEGVTFSGGVPTIWTMYLDHLKRTGKSAGSLRRLLIGGSAVPRVMAETFATKYGVDVQQIWGMTEISPLGVVATPTPRLTARGSAETNETLWTRQGRLQFGLELRLVDEQSRELPWDGVQAGALQVRGPWTIERYYGSRESAADNEGWFNTGDIATIDKDGYLRITDRQKDVIKSGGEWISSIDLENIAVSCPGVRLAAVVGVHHPKWEERPILILERNSDSSLDANHVRAFLEPRIARLWMPDAIIFADIPLTSTGKIDKKALRDQYKDHLVAA